ncbi:MAG: DUF445 family protein [Bradymonadales bacterium]|nr:DUF445 family protein [Bradymonadales bacterium]
MTNADEPSPSLPPKETGILRASQHIQGVRDWFSKWRQQFRTHPETGLPLRPRRFWSGDLESLTIEQLAFRAGKGLRWALKVFPPFCLALFFLSIFWDFHGVIRSCSIAGLIGYWTNWVAIKMLFWPHVNRPVFGQGLIPSQRTEIIVKVANEVCEKLINEEIIRRELEESRLIPRLTAATAEEIHRIVTDPEFISDTKRMIFEYASRLSKSEEFRSELLKTAEERFLYYTGQSMPGWIIGRLKGFWKTPLLRIVDQELDILPDTIDRLAVDVDQLVARLPQELERSHQAIDRTITRVTMSLIREVDVPALVLKQLNTVTSDQIEQAFLDFADDKLSYITLLGGILGLVGGFVIVWPIWSLLVLIGLGLLLTALDMLLYRQFRRSGSRSRPPSPPPMRPSSCAPPPPG